MGAAVSVVCELCCWFVVSTATMLLLFGTADADDDDGVDKDTAEEEEEGCDVELPDRI